MTRLLLLLSLLSPLSSSSSSSSSSSRVVIVGDGHRHHRHHHHHPPLLLRRPADDGVVSGFARPPPLVNHHRHRRQRHRRCCHLRPSPPLLASSLPITPSPSSSSSCYSSSCGGEGRGVTTTTKRAAASTTARRATTWEEEEKEDGEEKNDDEGGGKEEGEGEGEGEIGGGGMRGAMYRGIRDLRAAVALRRSRSTLPFGGGKRGRLDDDAPPESGSGRSSKSKSSSSSVVVVAGGGGAFSTTTPPTEAAWADDVLRRLNDAEIGLTNANREIARLRNAIEDVGTEIVELRSRSLGTTTTTTTTTMSAAAVGMSPPSDGTVVETGGGTREEDVEDVEDVDLDLPTGTLLPYSNVDRDVYDLSYGDVDWSTTNDADMAPPFIGEDECLVPGEPVIRVEKAPQNSRRIFAGIDIPSASVDDVWRLLTDYPNLQRVVPNLVVNEVLMLLCPDDEDEDEDKDEDANANAKDDGRRYDPDPDDYDVGSDIDQASRCRSLSSRMNGAILKQVGGAKVAGINFSARTTLEVREWPGGMPDFSMTRLEEEGVVDGKSRSRRLRESAGRELTRYVFPRPFALSSLPHRDISMQSVPDDDGEFRMYQGVWRMQPLPGCSPPGGKAMRLTYAVEVSPRPYLPVALVEGRIARDLCANLKAIRDIFAASDASSAPSSGGG